jgi:hypothetical protein
VSDIIIPKGAKGWDQAPSGAQVAEVKFKNDIETELGLERLPGALPTMCMIADQGGEVPWSAEAAHPNTRRVIDILIKMIGALELVQHDVQHLYGRTYLRLTDKGRNIVSIHRQRKLEISGMRDVSIEEAIEIGKTPVIPHTTTTKKV